MDGRWLATVCRNANPAIAKRHSNAGQISRHGTLPETTGEEEQNRVSPAEADTKMAEN
ncbi:hypothetical protein [Paracoccus jiaweipingae]|uniref:hypothetical protein n=1 Tax=unclassified Paracoccus (in: a-proteobacteria) TaxID=2688777 RepID=UPI00378BCE6A